MNKKTYFPSENEKKEIITLLKYRGDDFYKLIKDADKLRKELKGDIVTFIRNQNLNFSNICYMGCKFCSFSKREGDKGAYRLKISEIKEKTKIAKKRKVSEICITGGIDPKLNYDYYLELIKTIKKEYPEVHIHGFSPFEIYFLSKKNGLSYEDVLKDFKNAGLRSLAGTAAEILVDNIREIICPNKLKTDKWIEVIVTAHSLGIKSTSTIMYGHIETLEDIAEHLGIIKKVQEQTNGFSEFIPLPFVYKNTYLFREGISRRGSTGIEDLSLLATSRLYFGELLPNIQVSWVKTGSKFAQFGLLAGANDFGGTLFEENISREAGAEFGTYMEEEEIIRLIYDAGRIPARRSTLYEILEYF